MGVIYTPPTKIAYNDYLGYKVFLAGSIEMGKAENWQTKVALELGKIPTVTILNPRREQWDNSWEQSITNPVFKEQVDWELDCLEVADLVIFYFDPNTKSPITLLELGMMSQTVRFGKQLIVCCPNGFYRKGNVDIVTDRASKDGLVVIVEELSQLIEVAVELVKQQAH